MALDTTFDSYVAIKEFSIRGKAYKRGDVVDVSALSFSKLSQLLDQRWLRGIEKTTKKK
jgi:hypothetical protein